MVSVGLYIIYFSRIRIVLRLYVTCLKYSGATDELINMKKPDCARKLPVGSLRLISSQK